MVFKELIKYEAVGLSLTEKIQLMEVDLLENGYLNLFETVFPMNGC